MNQRTPHTTPPDNRIATTPNTKRIIAKDNNKMADHDVIIPSRCAYPGSMPAPSAYEYTEEQLEIIKTSNVRPGGFGLTPEQQGIE